MKRIICSLLVFVVAIFFAGCGGGSPNTPKLPVTKQFQFNGVDSFEFVQFHNATIIYHTPEELESLLNEKITKLLIEKKLLSTDANMNVLKIGTEYTRRFVGDESPIKSDALGYPFYAYKIEALDKNGTTLRNIERRNLQFKGGFTMNLQIIAASLRDKKYEVEFIDAFANTIVQSIEDLR
jgi:hypothetical protein